MKVNGVSFAGSYAKSHLGGQKIIHNAKLGLIPLVMAGGLFLSNTMRGQGLKSDVVNITNTEQTEQTVQTDQSEADKEKALPWYEAVPLGIIVSGGLFWGLFKMGEAINKVLSKTWTEEDLKYWNDNTPMY